MTSKDPDHYRSRVDPQPHLRRAEGPSSRSTRGVDGISHTVTSTSPLPGGSEVWVTVGRLGLLVDTTDTTGEALLHVHALCPQGYDSWPG